MNILFLLRLWPIYGGGETVTICLANEMAKRGWNVSVAYFKNSVRTDLPYIDQKVEAIKIDGVDCDEFHCSIDDASNVARRLTCIVKEKAIDVVINQWLPVDFIKNLKLEAPNVRVIKCFHTALFSPTSSDGLKGILKNVFKPLYNIVKRKKALAQVDEFLPYVDKYVFLSPTFQHQYEFWSKDKEKWQGKLDAIPNPLVFNTEISEEAFMMKENTVLVVGRMLETPKKISLVIKAWHEVVKHDEAVSWNLKIVGEGPSLDDYKQMAHDLGLKRISFEGFQQPQPYYEKAKIFLMTSAFEGFGMTLIEAQQMGVVPVVMDSFLSLHDIVKDGENGLIVANEDLQGFVDAVLKLMKDDAMRIKLAQKAMTTCRLFRPDSIVDRWERLIDGIEKTGGVKWSCCELPNKTISVVIPSYNRGHLLAQTLPTYLQENVVELILVDDCSTDNTLQVVKELQQQYPQIKYLRNECNLKQTVSKNRGIEIAKGDYIYFGDDDSLLLPGTIHALKQTLEYYECGAVMARPLCAGDNYKSQYHDAYVKWITNRNLAKHVHDIYDVSQMYFNWAKWLPYSIEVPCLPACMLIDSALAQKCKFDTNYHGCAYREETDFSFRLNLDFDARLMYDSRGVQINLPVYMVRNTGARSGGYDVWRKTAIECNNYFLDKLWNRINKKYQVNKTKEEMKIKFSDSLPLKESHASFLRKLAKDAYFLLFVNRK